LVARAPRAARQAQVGARRPGDDPPQPDLGRGGGGPGAARRPANGVRRAHRVSLRPPRRRPLPVHDRGGRARPRRLAGGCRREPGDRRAARARGPHRRARARRLFDHARHRHHGRGHGRSAPPGGPRGTGAPRWPTAAGACGMAACSRWTKARSSPKPTASRARPGASSSRAVPTYRARRASTSARGRLASDMRIATWNVNSLKARLDKVVWWLDRAKPDVLLMQETKLADGDAPHEAFERAGYKLAHHGQGRWNGVAIASRVGIDEIVTN